MGVIALLILSRNPQAQTMSQGAQGTTDGTQVRADAIQLHVSMQICLSVSCPVAVYLAVDLLSMTNGGRMFMYEALEQCLRH